MSAKNNQQQLLAVYAPADTEIPKKLGGSKLKELVKRDGNTKILIHYSLAYINPLVTSRDDGRVSGYDNSHDYQHRHLLGGVTRMPIMKYEDIATLFERQWQALAMQHVHNEPLELIL